MNTVTHQPNPQRFPSTLSEELETAYKCAVRNRDVYGVSDAVENLLASDWWKDREEQINESNAR